MYQPKESFLARAGCVVVTINYRLGALGFLKVEGGDYNCGIWDQVAALQWVQASRFERACMHGLIGWRLSCRMG